MSIYSKLFKWVRRMLNSLLKWLEPVLIVLFLLMFFTAAFTYQNIMQAQTVSDHVWPMYKQNPQRTALSSYIGPGSSTGPEVDIFIENGSFGAATVDTEGIIYFGANKDNGYGLYAFYPDGTLKWNYPSDWTRTAPAIGSDGTVYHNAGTKLLAIDGNGVLQWFRYFHHGYRDRQITLDNSNNIYIINKIKPYEDETLNRALICVSPDGDVHWAFDMEDEVTYLNPTFAFAAEIPPSSSYGGAKNFIAVSEEGKIFFDNGNDLYCLDQDGYLSWKKSYDYYIQALAIYDNSTLLIASGQTLYANNSFNPSIKLWSSYNWATKDSIAISSSGDIYIGISRPNWNWTSQRSLLYKYNSNGELYEGWPVESGSGGYSFVLIDLDDNVYAVRGGGSSTIVDAIDKDGNIAWSTRAASQSHGIHALAMGPDGTLFVYAGDKIFTIKDERIPQAIFHWFPEDVFTGEVITFDASASVPSEPEYEIVYYEWGWYDEGTFNSITSNSTASFWWEESGTYEISLRVTDSDNGQAVTTETITVHKAALEREYLVLASFWDPVVNWWDDLWKRRKDRNHLTEIDKWLRINPSTGQIEGYKFSWLKNTRFSGLKEHDLLYVLNREIDNDLAPGLTYKDYILGAMAEDELVNLAWRIYPLTSQTHYHLGFPYVADFIEIVISLAPNLSTVGVDVLKDELYSRGLEYISQGIKINHIVKMAKTIPQFAELGSGLANHHYAAALGRYFVEKDFGLDDKDWENILKTALDLEEGHDPGIIEETELYFNSLYLTYKNEAIIYDGLNPSFRGELKREVRSLILSLLEEYRHELPNRNLVWQLASPVELRVYDYDGNVTGMVETEVIEEIPLSVYDPNEKSFTVYLPEDSEQYAIEVTGLGQGSYAFANNYFKEGIKTAYLIKDAPITTNEVHYYILNADQNRLTRKIDFEGDGVFDETITTALLATPFEPFPADGSSEVSLNINLEWSSGAPGDNKDIYYEIYFGQTEEVTLAGTIGPYPADQTIISFDPGPLYMDTGYYWQIIAVDEFGIASEGPVWSFKTRTADHFDFSLMFNEGWNLLSLPSWAEDFALEQSMEGSISAWLAFRDGDWLSGDEQALWDQANNPARAVFLKVENPITVHFNWAEITPENEFARQDLVPGWNLISCGIWADYNVILAGVRADGAGGLTQIYAPNNFNSRKEEIYYHPWNNQLVSLITPDNDLEEKMSPFDGYWVYLRGEAMIFSTPVGRDPVERINE